MSEFNLERLRGRHMSIALRSACAAGLLALFACSPAQPTEVDTSPVVNIPSPKSPCEVPAPTCASPTPIKTEPTVPSKSASHLPPGYVCKWMDIDGKRQPLVSEDAVVVRVDGRCRTPDPLAPINIHAKPSLRGPVVDTVENGDELVATCAMKGSTNFMDARGRSNASRVVLRVETPNGDVGYLSEVTVGYVDETQLRLHGTLPNC